MDLSLPTPRHRAFLEHALAWCRERRIGLGLLGSLADGSSGPFSDIDLVLSGNAGADDLRRIMEGCERPVMGFFTVKPKGVLTAAYRNGFCVEVGVRKTAAESERSGIRFLVEEGFIFGSAPEYIELAALYRPAFVLDGDRPRLLYKSLLKHLGGKQESACRLLDELERWKTPTLTRDFRERGGEVLSALIGGRNLTAPAVREFKWLLARMSEDARTNDA